MGISRTPWQVSPYSMRHRRRTAYSKTSPMGTEKCCAVQAYDDSGDLDHRPHVHRRSRRGAAVTARRVNVSSDSTFETQVGYSRAVRVGPHVVVAGTTSPGDDVAAQARGAFRRIETALTEVGASLTDVIRTRMFVTDISRWEQVGAVHAEVFGTVRPVATMVEVNALITADLYVEIEVDAYVSD
jgi:enamine deaminase RidA (YjgF/YER057c/UK114 family)